MKAVRGLLLLLGLLALLAELPLSGGQRDICRLPKQEGPCHAYFPRWFYNWRTRRCERFIYGGCQGNANNFETIQECQRRCAGKVLLRNSTGHQRFPLGASRGCPPIRPGTVGICVQQCNSDSDCPRGRKCCSNGCGWTCRVPV